jgi:hypothetical protein
MTLIPTATNKPLAYVTPYRVFKISEVCVVHVTPSGLVTIVPSKPTATNKPLAYVMPYRVLVVPEVCVVHVTPSGLVTIVPSKPTATNISEPSAKIAYVTAFIENEEESVFQIMPFLLRAICPPLIIATIIGFPSTVL